MNRKILVLCCIATFAYGSASSREVWTLERCIEHACQNRADVRAQCNEIEARKLQLDQERNRYVPTVEANVTPAFSTGMNMEIFVDGDFLYLPARITGSMPLLDLSIASDRKAGEYALKASEAHYQQTRQETAIAVTAYYLQAEYAKTALDLASDIVEMDLENLEHVRQCFSEGSVPESELVKAELALASDEKNVVSARSLVDIALMELQYCINTTESIDVVEPAVSPATEYQAPVSPFPGVLAMEYELSKSQASLESAKSLWLPSLTLNASAGGFTYNAYTNADAIPYDKSFFNNCTAAVWLNLNIPIFDNSRKRTNLQMQKIDVQNRQLALSDARQGYDQKIGILRTKIQAEKESEAKLAVVVEKAESNYQAEQSRYEGGLSSWFDLQEAKKQLRQARLDALNNHIQCLLDTKSLEIYLGR